MLAPLGLIKPLVESIKLLVEKYFHLISIFTPFEHLIKLLVETSFKNRVLQTFKEI
jgi:hypothetical protein